MKRKEMKLYEQAFRNRWDVSPETKADVLNQMANILGNSDNDRNRIAAARVIMAAEAQNQSDEHKFIDKIADARVAQLDQVADELGIETATLEAIKGPGSDGAGSTQA